MIPPLPSLGLITLPWALVTVGPGRVANMLVRMHIDFKSGIFFVQRLTSPPVVSPFPQMLAQAVGF